MKGKCILPRAVTLALLPLGIALFMLLVHATEVHAASRAGQEACESIAAPMADTRIAQGGVISTIQSVINYVINATVFFPARTFQEAIEKATRNIFSEQLDEFREPLEQVVAVYAFQNGAVFGSLAIPGEVNAIGARLTEAAVPIWALALVLMGLSVLTRNAVGMGHGTVEVAAELARWLFIALASGNAIAIVNLVHTGFGALTYAIASEGGTVTASQFVAAFIPSEATFGVWPVLLLVIGCLLGLVVILVLSATYIARYVMLLAVAGLAPICIACEGIPFTRFVFRDWLSMFLRLEFLQIINIAVLIVFKAMALGAAGSGVAQALLKLAIMIGLASAIIGINVSAFKQVFGVAIDVVAQMRQAAEQIVRVIGVGIGAAITGGVALPALAGAAGSTSASAQSESAALPKGESTESNNAAHAAAVNTSGRAAWAMSGAMGGPAGAFLRGYGDGAFAGSSMNAHRANAAKADEMQRTAETRCAEGIAREMGATNADDVETIARSVTEPARGHTPEQMLRAHRDNAPALREMAHHYSGPARAAAVGGYRSFGDLAVAMAHERLSEGGVNAPAQYDASPSQRTAPASVQSSGVDEVSRDLSHREDAIPMKLTVADPSPQQEMSSQSNTMQQAPATAVGNGATRDDDVPSRTAIAQPAMPHETNAHSPSPSPIDQNMQALAVAGELQPTSNGLQSADTTPQQTALPSAPLTETTATPAIPTPMIQGVPSSADGLRVETAAEQQRVTTPSNALNEISPTPITSPMPPAQPTETPIPAMPSLSETAPANTVPFTDAAPINTPLPMPSEPAGAVMPDLNPPPTVPHNDSPSLPRDAPLADWAAQVPPTPVRDWIHTPPHIGSPGEQNILPFDFGMGAMLARTTESSPTHAPLWAQTAYSLRMAYGESYVTNLMQEAQSAQWSERELMSRVEQHVDATPAPRVVNLFWKPNGAASLHRGNERP
jgi:hypothetical protein